MCVRRFTEAPRGLQAPAIMRVVAEGQCPRRPTRLDKPAAARGPWTSGNQIDLQPTAIAVDDH